MRTAEQLLCILTVRYPPPEGLKHYYVLAHGKITLHVLLGNGGSYIPVHFDAADYDKSATELAEDILERLRQDESIRDPLPPHSVERITNHRKAVGADRVKDICPRCGAPVSKDRDCLACAYHVYEPEYPYVLSVNPAARDVCSGCGRTLEPDQLPALDADGMTSCPACGTRIHVALPERST